MFIFINKAYSQPVGISPPRGDSGTLGLHHFQHQVLSVTTSVCIKPEEKDCGARHRGLNVISSTFYQLDLNHVDTSHRKEGWKM